MKTAEILEAILNEANLNQSAFLKKVGISSSTFSELKNGRLKGISRKVASKIKGIYPQLSIQWMMTGEGSMYDDNARHEQSHDDEVTQLLDMLRKKDEQIDRLLAVIERLQESTHNI